MQTLAPNPPIMHAATRCTSVRRQTTRHATQCTRVQFATAEHKQCEKQVTTFVPAACKYIFHAARAQTGARDALEVS